MNDSHFRKTPVHILVLLTCLIAVFLPQRAAAISKNAKVYVNRISLSLYEKQSDSAEKITVYAGTVLTYKGEGSVSGYYKVLYGDDTRYIRTSKLSRVVTTDQTDVTQGTLSKAAADPVNLRKTPSSSAASLQELEKGDPVSLILQNSTWSYVVTDAGRRGYLRNTELTDDVRFTIRTSVKLYQSTSTSSDYTRVYAETALIYCGPAEKSNYYKVEYRGKTRYLYTTLSIDQVLGRDAEAFYAGGKCMTAQKKLNIRSYPSGGDTDNVLLKLSAGDAFTVYTEFKEGSWIYGETATGVKGYYYMESSSAFSDLGTPKLVSAKNGLYGVTLTWKAVSNATGYRIYRHKSGGSWAKVAEVDGRKTTTWLDTTLSEGENAYYSVQAIRVRDSGTVISAYDLTGISVKRAFLLEAPVCSSSNAKSGIRVSWKAVADAEQYLVLRSAGGFLWEKVTVTSKLYYLDRKTTDGTVYQYRVSCWDSGQEVLTSGAGETALRRLAAPLGIFLRQVGDSVFLAWDGWAGADAYSLYRSEDGENWSLIRKTTDPIYTDSDIAIGKTYFYAVRCIAGDSRGYANKTASADSITTMDLSGYSYINLIYQKLKKEATGDAASILVPYGTPVIRNGKDKVKSSGTYIGVTYQGKHYYIWQENGAADPLTDHLNTYSSGTAAQKRAIARALAISSLSTGYQQGKSGVYSESNGKYYFDCSGLVSYVLKTTMRAFVPTYTISPNVKRLLTDRAVFNQGYEEAEGTIITLYNRLNSSGTSLSRALSKLQPGDVILIDTDHDTPSASTHAMLYLGNGDYIHCTTYSDKNLNGVFIAPLDKKAQKKILAIRRFLPETLNSADETRYGKYNTTNYIYATTDMEGDPVDALSPDTPVTLLYTNNGNWCYSDGKWTKVNKGIGYVTYGDGKYGYVYLSTFSKLKPS